MRVAHSVRCIHSLGQRFISPIFPSMWPPLTYQHVQAGMPIICLRSKRGGVTNAWKRPLIESIFPGLIPSVKRLVARRWAPLKVENRDSSARRFLISNRGDAPLSVRALYQSEAAPQDAIGTIGNLNRIACVGQRDIRAKETYRYDRQRAVPGILFTASFHTSRGGFKPTPPLPARGQLVDVRV